MRKSLARKPLSLFGRPLVRALCVVAAANVLFLAAMFLAQGDRCAVLSRVQTAFDTGELTTKDFLFLDSRRGWFQFDDCNALQILINEDSPRLRRALAPVVYQDNEDWEGQCRVLRYLVEGWVDPATLISVRYSRYWHGYDAVAALSLRYMELRDLRRLLTVGVWLSIAIFGLAGWRSGGRVRLTAGIIALAAAIFWAVPYFAPGLTQGPGDILLFLGLAVIAARPGIATDFRRIVPYAAGFGALIAFVEMLTAKIPTAAAFLAALTLAAVREAGGSTRDGVDPPYAALAAVAALCFGVLATVIAKLVLAGVFVEREAGAHFMDRLSGYIGIPEYYSRWLGEPEKHLPGLLLPFARLARQAHMIAYGSGRAGNLLVIAIVAAWIAAAIRAWRVRRAAGGPDVLILVSLAALVPIAWVLLLPLHAYIHAPFIVRMLVVPIALAPLALSWPLRAAKDVSSPVHEG